MLIERLDLYRVRIPTAINFRTSYGDHLATDTILVRMESGGVHGWGESCPPWFPGYSSEYTAAAFLTVRELMAPKVIGQRVDSAEALLERLAFVKGNQFARAALEIAWWVLEATRLGVPLHEALGGKGDRVKVGADFGVQDTLDELMAKIQGAIDAGFPRIKLKFRPGWDVKMVDAVRATFPDHTFHIDCNAAYTIADAPLFRSLDILPPSDMTQLQPVLWTRGVLLAPQHLQAHDRFLEDSLQFKLSALAPGRWGFQHLEIDEQALAGGELRVRSASGVFPDGLLFDFPSSDSVPPPKPIHAAFAPDATDLVVYLAVPEYRDGSRNVENGAMGGSTRYVSDIVSRRDENTGTAEKKIEIARKNLRLLTANESHDGHATLPIARVVRTPSGTFTLDARYVPPLLNFAASAYLTTMTAELLARLSARSTDLSELRRQRNQSLADFGTAGIATFWLLFWSRMTDMTSTRLLG